MPAILRAAASLRLTLACLAYAMVLVLLGTFAQVSEGLFVAQERYFKSWFIWFDIGDTSVPILPGGHLLGAIIVVNLLAAHLTRFRWSWSKLGIHVIHVGLLLLILSQFFTDYLARESRITLDVGQRTDFTEAPRESEFVVGQTVIPFTELQSGQTIPLPAGELRILATHANARVTVDSVTPLPRETRLDRRDLPVVEYEFNGSKSVATLQPTTNHQQPTTFLPPHLRPARTALPFTLQLDEFIHDRHPGTSVPSRFASRLNLTDENGATRPVQIEMNQPLRIAGRTIYQASFANDDQTSILQVVENPTSILPYIACALITLGLLLQFGHHLIKALRRPRNPPAQPHANSQLRTTNYKLLIFPSAALLITAILLLVRYQSTTTPAAHLAALPVQAAGRIQPLDTLARNTLTLLSGKSTVTVIGGEAAVSDQQPTTINYQPLPWLTTHLTDTITADTLPVFRLVHPQILTLVGQPSEKPTRLSFDDLRPHLTAIRKAAQATQTSDLPDSDPYRRAILALDNALHTYAALRLSFQANTGYPDLAAELQTYTPLIPNALTNAAAWKQGEPHNHEALATFVTLGRAYRDADRLAVAQPAWPLPDFSSTWTSLPGALLASTHAGSLHPAASLYADLLEKPDDPAAIDALTTAVTAAAPEATANARSEFVFNTLDLFGLARILYLVAFLLAVTSWLINPTTLRPAASLVALLAFFLTTAALLWRMALLGRPPVTNLYSSALFVAWVSVGVGLLVERLTRDGLITAACSALGFASLLIAHHLAADTDTLGVLIAVLDSNFWLATHVITITIGYAATFLAGFLGIAYLLLRATSRRFDAATEKRLTASIYGVICFALLFSFVGTILGGIWADQSWGRFWGWDPKENGALLIVIWNAIILHARWGGMIRARGLAVLAILGNIVTAFSWFGTNLLGIGLHSYGFTETGFLYLAIFTATQLLITLLASAKVRSQLNGIMQD